MGVIKTRPTVKLFLPARLAAGATHEGVLQLTAKRAVPVDFVDLRIDGQSWNYVLVSSGKSTTRSYARVAEVALGVRLREGGELPAGETRLPFTLPLRAGLPPTARGVQCGTTYTLAVHVSIPWWPDRRAEFEVAVPHPGVRHVPATPLVASTRPEGPTPGELHMELSMDSTTLAPGGELRGAVAFQNLAQVRAPVRLRVELVERARVARHGRAVDLHAVQYHFEIPLAGLVEGVGVPFRLALPADLGPSCATSVYQTSWSLRCTAVRRLARDVAVELPIAVAALAPGAEVVHHAPPAVGGERVRAVYEEVARRDHLILGEDGALHGDRHGVAFSVVPTRSARGTASVTAVLSYPRLGLGLAPAGWSLFGKGLKGDMLAGQFRARDETQGREILASLGIAARGCRVAQLSDTRMEVEGGAAGTVPALSNFLAQVDALARTFARAYGAVPLPTNGGALGPEFEAVAVGVGGRFVRGAVAVDVALPEGDATAGASFDADGTVVGLEYRLQSHDALPAEAALAGTGSGETRWPSSWSGDAREAGLGLARVGTLRVAPDGITLEVHGLPAPGVVREQAPRVLQSLGALARALLGRRVGYR